MMSFVCSVILENIYTLIIEMMAQSEYKNLRIYTQINIDVDST